MATIDLQVIAPTLPPGSCVDPAVVQLIGKTRVLFDTENSQVIQSPNEPTVDQRDYIWVKISALTNEIEGVFSWAPLYGLWIRPHFPGGIPTNERRIYLGSLASLELYDGGESATVSDTTGPFWEQDTDMADKFPLGVGATVATVDTDQDVFDDAAPGAPQAHSVYFIKPTGRIYDRSA